MIYVDLDNTLIDSVYRLELDTDIAVAYGLTTNEFSAAIDKAVQKHGIHGFGPDALFEACRQIKPDFSELVLKNWWMILKHKFLFPDTMTFLGCFCRRELSLITTGNKKFQLAKIEAHNFREYLSEIMILGSPKSNGLYSPQVNSFFIDDSPREIDAMKEKFPDMCCIQVREPAPWEKQKISRHADFRCADLLEAIRHIKPREVGSR